MIKTLSWTDNAVVMIDQNARPRDETYLTCRSYTEVISAINNMTVRGAPAIGVAAAMGIALGMQNLQVSSEEDLKISFYRICDEFSRTRPTAVNLFWAVGRMKRCFEEKLESGIDIIKEALVTEAKKICEEDIATNRQMGMRGRRLIKDGDSILTHCNAGALATAGYGTALGVIRAAREEGKIPHVFVDETRPLLQGARLTAWELMRDNIPATLITDNNAGFLMKQGKIDLVLVGADRIAINGDVANKIGTYSLAVLAHEHNIPFYVAAPLSTIDVAIKDGRGIPIEERDEEEVLCIRGMRIATDGMKVYNPAFDVTPNRFISAIITEVGIATSPFEKTIKNLLRQELK
jgi:methylthioribose-1-phosphate isomerase